MNHGSHDDQSAGSRTGTATPPLTTGDATCCQARAVANSARKAIEAMVSTRLTFREVSGSWSGSHATSPVGRPAPLRSTTAKERVTQNTRCAATVRPVSTVEAAVAPTVSPSRPPVKALATSDPAMASGTMRARSSFSRRSQSG